MAFSILTPISLALLRFAVKNLVPTSLAPVKFAASRLALVKFAFSKLAPVKSACDKFAPVKFALYRSFPERSIPERSIPEKSAFGSKTRLPSLLPPSPPFGSPPPPLGSFISIMSGLAKLPTAPPGVITALVVLFSCVTPVLASYTLKLIVSSPPAAFTWALNHATPPLIDTSCLPLNSLPT